MKIGPLFIMVTALAAVVAASAAIGALLGMLIAFLLAADMSSAAPIGALGGGFTSFMFLLNAGMNGGGKGRKARRKETACLEGYKASVAPFCGLFSLYKKIAQNGRLSPEAASGTAGRT